MNKSASWNNKLAGETPAELHGLIPFSYDPNRTIILGSRVTLSGETNQVIMLGTDTSGELHLGHGALFCIAESIKTVFDTKMIVSLNELESLHSRGRKIQDIYESQRSIIEILDSHNCAFHSRIEDRDLVLFSSRLWKLLYDRRDTKLFRHYEDMPDMADIFSIAVMATTPLILSMKESTESVLLVYGADERAHLELIYDLYNLNWFKEEVNANLGVSVPNINYLMIKTLPDRTGKYKMSKTRPDTTVFLNSTYEQTDILHKHSEDYLRNLLQLVEEMGNSRDTNRWYTSIKSLIERK
jgi:hypothetical protein